MVYRWWEFTDDRVSVHDDIPMDNIRMDHFINLFVVKFYCLKRRKSSGLALRYSGYVRLGWVDSLVKLKQCNPTQPKINPSMPSRGGGNCRISQWGIWPNVTFISSTVVNRRFKIFERRQQKKHFSVVTETKQNHFSVHTKIKTEQEWDRTEPK